MATDFVQCMAQWSIWRGGVTVVYAVDMLCGTHEIVDMPVKAAAAAHKTDDGGRRLYNNAINRRQTDPRHGRPSCDSWESLTDHGNTVRRAITN